MGRGKRKNVGVKGGPAEQLVLLADQVQEESAATLGRTLSSINSSASGWCWTTLGGVADVTGGVTKNAAKAEGTSYPYLRVANVYANELRLGEISEIQVQDSVVDRVLLKRGDLLVVEGNGSADQIGRVALWDGSIDPCVHQNHLIKARFSSEELSKWTLYWLLSPVGREAIVGAASSTSGLHTLSISKVSSLTLPLAPQRETEAITSVLDEQWSKLDAAIAGLRRTQANLKRYRASVLKAAVEGRLVPTEAELARQEGREYEPASVLLERILTERRRRWEEAELAKMKAKGKVPKDDGWKGRYEEPCGPSTVDAPKLPPGWCWATTAQLCWDAGYGTSQKCTSDASGPPVLRIPNVQAQRISLDDIKYATGMERLSSDGVVQPGDFLFIRTNGSKSLVGRGAVVSHLLPREHHFASYLIRLRMVQIERLPEWVSLLWHAPIVRDQVLRDAASSAGQYNVSLSAASSYLIPLAPIGEQMRILNEVERFFSIADSAYAVMQASRTRIARLRQSILKSAFEGKLVDQDPTDEPASALLARIRAQRSSATTQPPTPAATSSTPSPPPAKRARRPKRPTP